MGMAEQADVLALYQAAVQDPSFDIDILTEIFQEERGRRPMRLREDFCGTALASVAWVASDSGRCAIGVDLDGPTLAWGQINNVKTAGDSVSSRIRLVEA